MPIRFQVEPDFYDHPKTLGMSDAATALWVRAGSYSVAKLSDGFVSDDALALLSKTPEEAARELTRRGLWRRSRGGYRFHQWDSRNLSRARVEAEREADRERKRLERLQARKNGKAQANSHSVHPDVRPESGLESDRSPPTVVSVSESVLESVSGRDATAVADPPPSGLGPEPPRKCQEHRDDPDPPSCRRCATLREANKAWHAAKRTRLNEMPDCPQHVGQPAHNCGGCRADRLAGAA